ncbi:MAG: cytochrome c [Candidatus Brocadia sp.]|nr:cytochrome c [Candidatus Brocadia sp.]
MGDWEGTVIYTISFLVSLVLFAGFSTVYGQEGGEINAKDLFNYHCATCHGTDGKGTKRGRELKVPNLADADWQATKTDEEILNSIINGKNKMPRWNDKIKPEEIQTLAKYVRELAPKKNLQKQAF